MKSITNLFCIIGKPGAGKSLILNHIFTNLQFVNECSLKRFVYGTTRKIKPKDINGITYQFYTVSEYNNIDPAEIIESRSYDNPCNRDIDYYFTLRQHIIFGCNYIGITSTFQYEELKKWANLVQLSMPTVQINIYPIYIETPIFDRIQNLLMEAESEQDVYVACGRILSERYEYSSLLENKVIDKFNPDSCVVQYSTMSNSLKSVTDQILRFIKERLAKEI